MKGGKRNGSGRPKIEVKRKQRALHFFDHEWEMIREKAEKSGASPREYLYQLAERDNP
jgi:uncharacterized protein (DUF111 family)